MSQLKRIILVVFVLGAFVLLDNFDILQWTIGAKEIESIERAEMVNLEMEHIKEECMVEKDKHLLSISTPVISFGIF